MSSGNRLQVTQKQQQHSSESIGCTSATLAREDAAALLLFSKTISKIQGVCILCVCVCVVTFLKQKAEEEKIFQSASASSSEEPWCVQGPRVDLVVCVITSVNRGNAAVLPSEKKKIFQSCRVQKATHGLVHAQPDVLVTWRMCLVVILLHSCN